MFPPPAAFAEQARVNAVTEAAQRAHAATDLLGFWAEQAKLLSWHTPFQQTFDDSAHPFVRWFVGGKLNLTESCLDRHLRTWRRNKAALIWEGEPGDSRVLTYFELHREVCRAAAALHRLGVVAGDRVILYMPMVPELATTEREACAEVAGFAERWIGDWIARYGNRSVSDAIRERPNV